ncbi:unnamed protein product [Linum trigynum]|uniref:Uncharacterized protein n=1 Tax=Linum trigynum TaxID=586398 RepID=A0AAV2G878_9ROSI
MDCGLREDVESSGEASNRGAPETNYRKADPGRHCDVDRSDGGGDECGEEEEGFGGENWGIRFPPVLRDLDVAVLVNGDHGWFFFLCLSALNYVNSALVHKATAGAG